jgi:hypothetical protein
METADEAENEASVHIEVIEEAYIGEINAIKETREQNSNKRRSIISAISQAVSLLSILSRSERRYTRNSVNILYIY